jgi:TorA maturation chaperone TorD
VDPAFGSTRARLFARAYGQLRWAFLPADPRAHTVLSSTEAAAQLQELTAALGFGSPADVQCMARFADGLPTKALFVGSFEGIFRGARVVSPFETDYTSTSPFEQANALADISGFYRAFHLETQSMDVDRGDHVAAELEFLCVAAWLEAKAHEEHREEDAHTVGHARGAFLEEHAGRWLGPFASRCAAHGAPEFFGAAARLSAALVEADLSARGVQAAPARPSGLPMA